MKLEDLVQTQNEKIDSYYYEYDSIMEEIESSSPNNENIKRLHKAGTKLFNYMDGCYAALDAASEDEINTKQTQLNNLSGLFSDAFEKTIPNHFFIMKAFYEKECSPSKHAFSGMQELIVQTKNKDEVSKLKELCIANNLPIKGFEKKRRFKIMKEHKFIIDIVLAILSIITMIILLFFLDSEKGSYIILSVVIAILGGISSKLLSGALSVKIEGIKATSGYGMSIIIFFVLQGIPIFSKSFA
ncbi:hypothetical protein GHV27_00520 [Proteus mirabilis]|nr:hypothetical protein [Proteus mirabilis]